MSRDRLRTGDIGTLEGQNPPPQATLDEFPDRGFLFSVHDERRQRAVRQLKENPRSATVIGTWNLRVGLEVGKRAVPMLSLRVGETVIHVDCRNPLGKQIYSRHLEENQ